MTKIIRKYCAFIVFLVLGFLSVSVLYLDLFFTKKNGLSLFDKKPFISIVVTSYNYEKYLPKTLDSIVAQTYKNYEVIIVDDGSKDNSLQVIKEYTEKYDNFYLYQHDGGINKGLPASVKLGVEKSRGEFVSFLESDDYWREDNLLEKVKMINKHPDAVIISNHVAPFGDAGEVSVAQGYAHSIFVKLKERNDLEIKIDLENTIPTFSSVTIRRDVLNKLDYDTPIPAFIDVYLNKQILIKYPLYFINQPITYWRRHTQSYNASFKNSVYYNKSDEFIKKLKEVVENQSI